MKNLGCADVRRHDDLVMHPLAFAASCHDPGFAEISEVPGNLRLRLIEDLDEVADANLLLSHKVQQPEAGCIAECLKETFQDK